MKPQEIADRKRRAAQKRVDHWMKEAIKAAKMLAQWQRRAAHYARRASMTDAEIEAERVKRAKRPQKVVRSIDVD